MDRLSRRKEKLKGFDPNGVGVQNGHFIGLPFDEEESEIVVISVPWDVTVSFGAGTAQGPQNVLNESGQLDLEDPAVPMAWERGLYVRPPSSEWNQLSKKWRKEAEPYLTHLEHGGNADVYSDQLSAINEACSQLHEAVYREATQLFQQGKVPGLLGGDHSTPFGLIRASTERYPGLGILQVDAHMDLRKAYEGFIWSHASIFYNVMTQLPVRKLVQAGIRDYCMEEWQFASSSTERIVVYRDRDIRHAQFQGVTFHKVIEGMISQLPEFVHISVDIDGLEPSLCPGTGTPVPGGFTFAEAVYLLEQVKTSGRRIVSFDLCEVGGMDPWDANVGARVLYKLANLAG